MKYKNFCFNISYVVYIFINKKWVYGIWKSLHPILIYNLHSSLWLKTIPVVFVSAGEMVEHL